MPKSPTSTGETLKAKLKPEGHNYDVLEWEGVRITKEEFVEVPASIKKHRHVDNLLFSA